MAGSLAKLFVEIVADTKGFDNSIDGTKKKTKEFETGLDKLGAGAKKLLAAGVFVAIASKIKDLGVASTKFASDLGESINAVNVVFGDSSGIIQEWGEQASEQAGLSKAAFNESSAVIGTLLKKTGQSLDDVALSTIDVTTRSADLASVFNKDLSVATTAVGAALRGETEPIRQFGIDVSAAAVEAEALSSGLVNNKKDITEAVKVQARYNLIMAQSAGLAGDFAATNDDLANSSRVLEANIENAGAELGVVFLPIAAKVVGILRDITVKLKEQAPIVRNTLSKAWINFGSNTQKVIAKLGGSFQVLGSRLKASWITAVNSVQIAFNDLAISITTNTLGAVSKFLSVASKLPFVGKQFAKAANSVDGLNESLAKSSEESKKANQESIDSARTEIEQTKETLEIKLKAIEDEKNARLEALTVKQEAEAKDTEIKKATLLEVAASEAELEQKRLDALALAAEAAQIAKDKRVADLVEDIELYSGYASQIAGIMSNIQQVRLNDIETSKNAKIEALDKEALGEEAYSAAVKKIEKEAALDSWKIQKEQLAFQKAASLIEIATNTAVGISKAYAQGGIFGLATGIIVGVAGAAQAAVVISQPDPPKPQLATGARIEGTQRGTEVIVGENGDAEEIFGMGSAGVPRRQQLANEVANVVLSKLDNTGGTTNFYSLVSISDPQQLRQFAQAYEPFADEYRRGRS